MVSSFAFLGFFFLPMASFALDFFCSDFSSFDTSPGGENSENDNCGSLLFSFLIGLIINFGMPSFATIFSLLLSGAFFGGGDLISGFSGLTATFLSFFGVVFPFIFAGVSGVDGFFFFSKGDLTTEGVFSLEGVGGEVKGEEDFDTGLAVFLGVLAFFLGLDLGSTASGLTGGFCSFFFVIFVLGFEGPATSVELAAVTGDKVGGISKVFAVLQISGEGVGDGDDKFPCNASKMSISFPLFPF